MAYTTANTAFSATPFSGIQRLVARIAEGFANRRLYNKTYNELAKLGDRELMDLGLSRSSISSIAYEAVYKN